MLRYRILDTTFNAMKNCNSWSHYEHTVTVLNMHYDHLSGLRTSQCCLLTVAAFSHIHSCYPVSFPHFMRPSFLDLMMLSLFTLTFTPSFCFHELNELFYSKITVLHPKWNFLIFNQFVKKKRKRNAVSSLTSEFQVVISNLLHF